MKYNENELEELKIVATKMTRDNSIYIAVEHNWMIRDLYTRKAECKQEDVVFKPYVPPQFHARYVALGEICKGRRAEDPDLRTQMRFGTWDIELLTKYKNSGEGFKPVTIDYFTARMEIPPFDDKIKWNFRQDRPPRRRVTSSPTVSPSNSPTKGQPSKTVQTERQASQPSKSSQVAAAEKSPSLVRQRSVENEKSIDKKRYKTTTLIEVNDDGSFETPMGAMNISDIK